MFLTLSVIPERWFDTTHTFHWSWGEMTMTPLDLFALTGIPTGGQPIEVFSAIRISEEGAKATLGWRPGSVGIPHFFLIERRRMERHRTATGRVQLPRCA